MHQTTAPADQPTEINRQMTSAAGFLKLIRCQESLMVATLQCMLLFICLVLYVKSMKLSIQRLHNLQVLGVLSKWAFGYFISSSAYMYGAFRPHL